MAATNVNFSKVKCSWMTVAERYTGSVNERYPVSVPSSVYSSGTLTVTTSNLTNSMVEVSDFPAGKYRLRVKY